MKTEREITGDVLHQQGLFTVKLTSCGNIDHGQEPDRPKFGVPDDLAHVRSLAEASMAARAYIDHNDLGGGNWTGGDVTDGNNQLVARISYNGRVWTVPSEAHPHAPAERQR